MANCTDDMTDTTSVAALTTDRLLLAVSSSHVSPLLWRTSASIHIALFTITSVAAPSSVSTHVAPSTITPLTGTSVSTHVAPSTVTFVVGSTSASTHVPSSTAASVVGTTTVASPTAKSVARRSLSPSISVVGTITVSSHVISSSDFQATG